MNSPSNRIIQIYNIMKDGKSVKFEAIVKAIGAKPITAMVYISDMRTFFGAEFEATRDGRKVIAYRLTNAKDLAPKMVKGVKTVAAPKAAKTKITTVTKKVKQPLKKKEAVLDELDINEVTDKELDDLKIQMGLN